MKKLTCLALLPAFLLAGCMTAKDFQGMSADGRARLVCDQQGTIVRMKTERENYNRQIRDSEEALRNGYRTERECTKNHESHKTECKDVRTRIDHRLERNNIREWTSNMNHLDREIQTLWTKCYSHVYPMSPEEAYNYFGHS